MKQFRLNVNDYFSYLGAKYYVHSIEPPKLLFMRIDHEDKRVHEIEYIKLITDPTFKPNNKAHKLLKKEEKKEEKRHRSILDSLSEKHRESVSEKFIMIKPILVYERAKDGDYVSILKFNDSYGDLIKDGEMVLDISKEELYKRLSDKYGKSKRQLQRYVQRYYQVENQLTNHGIEGLVRKSIKEPKIREDEKLIEICHPKNKDEVLAVIRIRKEKEYASIIKDGIEKHYLSKVKPSIAHVHQMMEIACDDKGLERIGYDTVYYLITNRLEPEIKDRFRMGEIASQKYDPILRGISNEIAKAPLHIVQIDHTQLDMDVIDEDSGFNIGRPWITMGIDVFTRMIWCLHVSMEDPSGNKVRKAIEHGIFLKKSRERFNTINEWDIHGIPSIIYLDNGPDFKSAAVKRMIEETLEAEVRYRPVGTPKYGAIIERVFGTINKNFIHNQIGNRKSNPKELGEYDAEKEAILTLSDITEILTMYITDIYHHKVHSSLPLDYPTPTARYYQALEVLGFPNYIEEEDEDYYRLELLPITKRKLSRDGIRFENVYYSSSNLNNIPKNKRHKIKFDPDDMSRIYILDQSKHEYIQVAAYNPPAKDLQGMSIKTYKIIRKILKDIGELVTNQIPGSKLIVKAKKILVDKINQKIKKNKSVRKQALNSGLSLTAVPTEQLKPQNTNTSKSQLEELVERLNNEKAEKRGQS
ncbi:DDE-type integrase/transposase/recombinase [Ornithinibacillus sp. L9]|uniref:DDE-type integrase/transposase/recombinase n=1 Tax=Ornithinibacillus caprae TaxID=2678566 RepID=A0A6N8FPC2_9BACI|nr:Mu transposase C-terminal domain-containing protein [Ornithinibacillus caprae]MUK89318.1 DDE-type integrase/transposase/recombinase [Ornithinibacillus caprae]